MNYVYAYTRKQAIEDGVLIDVTKTTKEAGLKFPTAVSAAVWSESVAVPANVSSQDETGRLWDIVWMLRFAIHQQRTDGPQIKFDLFVQNEEHDSSHRLTLKAICGPGDCLSP